MCGYTSRSKWSSTVISRKTGRLPKIDSASISKARVFRALPKTTPHGATLDALLDGLLVFLSLAAAGILVINIDGASSFVPVIKSMATPLAMLVAGLMVLANLFMGTYHRRLDESQVMHRFLGCLLLAAIGTCAALKAFDPPDRNQLYGVLGIGMLVLLVAVLVVRGAATWLRTLAGTPRVIIIGTGPRAAEVFDSIRADAQRLREVVGFYSASIAANQPDMGAPVFDGSRALVDIVRAFGAKELVDSDCEQADWLAHAPQVQACRAVGVSVLSLTEFFERHRIESHCDTTLMNLNSPVRTRAACRRWLGRLSSSIRLEVESRSTLR